MSAAGRCRFCGHKSRFHPAEPDDYITWGEWADKKCRTHHQEPCPDCGRFTIWKPGAAPAATQEDET